MAVLEDKRTDLAPASPEALIREARELQRRRRRRRGVAALLGFLVLAGGGIALIGGGGASAGPGVVGPFPAGIAARAADPEGGLAWAVRAVRASGWTCVQLGRQHGDSLGVIGKDGSFGDDGRFHPFGPSPTNRAFCAQNDGNGHAFLSVQLGAQPASGEGTGYHTASQCRLAADVARFERLVLRQSVCPDRDLRFVQYGLLGPDATSVTYIVDGRSEVEQTHGPDGAYLVVAPSSPRACARLDRSGVCGAAGSSYNAQIFAGMIIAVHYRNGRTCRLNRSYPGEPVFLVTCPLAGYVPPRPPIGESQVAAPVSVRLITARRYCFRRNAYLTNGSGPAPATDTAPYIPCDGPVPAEEFRATPAPHGTLIVFSWTARQPVSSGNSRYEFLINAPCGGGAGGSTNGRIHAGERLTRGVFEPSGCTGTFTGSVGYDPNVGPGGFTYSNDQPGQNGSILVGRFTTTIR